MGFKYRIFCMAVISKAFKLQGQEETPKASMWKTISPSILRHPTEQWRGITNKYDLETDITWKIIYKC
jgi:hypothetical protein